MTIRDLPRKFSAKPDLTTLGKLLAVCAILFAGASFAETVPDASRILDETKRALPAEQMPEVVAPEQREVTAVDLGPEGILPLKGFTFEGNTALSDAELALLLQPYIGQDAGIDDLYNLAGMLAQIYAAKGYLATVRILQQDVSDGIVNFTIVEARFGKANINYADTDASQIQQGVIEAIVAHQAQQGELVEYAQVDRALLLANDRAGYDVVGGLVPGDENQETALSLRVAPKERFSGVLNLDNHGSRATGNERAILSTQFASPTGVGDRLGVNALVTQGVRYAGLSYTRPIGFDGMTYTLDASHTDYRIVEADDAAQ